MSINLSQYDDDWAETPEAPDQAGPPPGTYQVQVKHVELTESQTGKTMLKWEFAVLSGDYAQSKIFLFNVLPEPNDPKIKERLSFLKRDLAKLGFRDAFSQLPGYLENFIGMALEVQRKKGKDRDGNEQINTYINKAINLGAVKGYTPDPDDEVVPPPPEDEIPW